MVLKLRAWRRIRDKTQREMAQALGLERTVYANLEKKAARATYAQTMKICNLLQITPDEVEEFHPL
jgi:transcriptional regulator with XRE-family HTH domain